MQNFNENIQEFQRNGTYEYKFDNVGNLIFNEKSSDFSRVYLSFPLKNTTYNYSKVNSFYKLEFEEFIPAKSEQKPQSTIEAEMKLQAAEEENSTLKVRLDTLISASESDSSQSKDLATKQVILELRKALGQGRVDSDFSADFPYTKLDNGDSR